MIADRVQRRIPARDMIDYCYNNIDSLARSDERKKFEAGLAISRKCQSPDRRITRSIIRRAARGAGFPPNSLH